MIRLLLADVDGTLVTREKVLTERARSAVARMRVAGIQFAITSGRPPRGMQMLIEPSIVAASAIFGAKDYADAIAAIRAHATAAAAQA